mgnify:CR=1 FL=1
MEDAALFYKDIASESSNILFENNLEINNYNLATIHRAENTDDVTKLKEMVTGLNKINRDKKVIVPLHPRTKKKLEALNLNIKFKIIEPVGYLDMISLINHANVVLTDSGGLQEETTALGVPCITIRENTERPITVDEGSNVLVGTNPTRIIDETRKILSNQGKSCRRPKLWDGKAAERIVAIMTKELSHH